MSKPRRPPVSRPQARRAEQKDSRKAVADYRLLFQRNLAGLCRSTTTGKILECNDAFARILGYESPEEAMTQPATMFYMEPEAREGMLAPCASPEASRTSRSACAGKTGPRSGCSR